MTSNDPPEVVELFHLIASVLPHAIRYGGTIVRSVGMNYANENDFLSGDGAAEHGGRWTRPGLRAVYASLDIITATHEAYHSFLDYGISLSAIRPRVMAGAVAKLDKVLDLCNLTILRKIGFTLTELVDEDWKGIQDGGEESWTQAIGRGCRNARLEAILVPSARNPGGKNIVVFSDQLTAGSTLKLLLRGDLPPHPSGWPS